MAEHEDFDGQFQQPSKRRKTNQVSQHVDSETSVSFVPLLRGSEKSESVETRAQNFINIWGPKGRIIDVIKRAWHVLLSTKTTNLSKGITRLVNEDTIDEIASFVTSQSHRKLKAKLPAGLIVAGLDDSTSLEFFSVAECVNSKQRSALVNLGSGQSGNLKTILKHINQHATSQLVIDEDETLTGEHKNGRYLPYDLEILHDYVQSHSISTVILAFHDSEAFEPRLLEDLVEVLSSWSDRIPFVLLFKIATSIDLFQSRLSRDTIKRLSGAEFYVTRIDTGEIFKEIHSAKPVLFFGPTISGLILQQQRDFLQSTSALKQTLKYVYMTHFFANPLSVLLRNDPSTVPLQREHYEAIRNLKSFRRYAQDMLHQHKYDSVRDILDDNESLHESVMREYQNSKKALESIFNALEIICRVQSSIPSKTVISWPDLYTQAMSGSLLDSPTLDEILTSIKRLPSDDLTNLLDLVVATPDLLPNLAEDLNTSRNDLNRMTETLDKETVLRSAYDVHHSTLRTTVIAQKVSLSKNSAKLSPQDTAYTKIVDRVYDTLIAYMQNTLINPSELFLNEILIYDSTSPHREVFTPRPRFAIERALSSPHDYLGCECCSSSGEGAGLEASQPATAILYQLYLESGSIINTADLWEAFRTIVGGEGGNDEDEDKDDEEILALFSRALAELKYMGMVKESRKKADHLQKLAWKGF